MKRSKQLVHFSHEHHLALVLARRAKINPPESVPFRKVLEDFPSKWNEVLIPHFAEEERLFLPHLIEGEGAAMAKRLTQEHEQLRALAGKTIAGDPDALKQFGIRLYDHVRFEERELFPYFERLVGAQ